MNIAAALPLAATWGTRGGWWILMCVLMMVCMAAMMLGMGHRGSRSEHGRPAQWDRPTARERPDEILDRRYAEGAISLEDYEQRKQELAKRDPDQTEPLDAQPSSTVGPT